MNLTKILNRTWYIDTLNKVTVCSVVESINSKMKIANNNALVMGAGLATSYISGSCMLIAGYFFDAGNQAKFREKMEMHSKEIIRQPNVSNYWISGFPDNTIHDITGKIIKKEAK